MTWRYEADLSSTNKTLMELGDPDTNFTIADGS
jgi:hypothetical protein